MSGSHEIKAACFFPPDRECPISCPGLKGSRFIGEYVFEVCPNPRLTGTDPTVIDCNDDGPIVVILHQNELPDKNECIAAISR